METITITTQDNFKQIVAEYNESRYCLELLRFFGTHPFARFNRQAVIRSINVDSRKTGVDAALIQLTDDGVVKARTENNDTFYSLAEDELARRQALELARLEWSRWQLVLKQVNAVPAAVG